MAWNEFRGQDRAVSILKRYIDLDRVQGSFIFSGLKGIGKFSIAKEFAKSASCLNSRGNSCGTCSNCLQIEKESHPDVYIIRPEDKSGEITIDQIRDLQKFLNLSAQNCETKFFIIDDADTMNIEAANAFLKSLEEPPMDSVIILATSRSDILIPTIRSRCREIKFKNDIRNMFAGPIQLSDHNARRILALSQAGLGDVSRYADLENYPDIRLFFRRDILTEESDIPLHQQRVLLKSRIKILIFYLRDFICFELNVKGLAVLINPDTARNILGLDIKDLIEKIEKLEYLYSALDSNVSPNLIYKILFKIYKEAEAKIEALN
ncbi:MAG: AAA family ATPase [Candidatus Omnitrophica bacterium]|nr:AAA family ATPase [Candidatus Omnitrophota bacterium]